MTTQAQETQAARAPSTYFLKAPHMRALAVALLIWVGTAPECRADSECPGDCDASGKVSISELVRGVNISLHLAPLDSCPAFDRGNDGSVSIADLVAGVANAIAGCDRHRRAFVLATDFSTGAFGTIALDQPRIISPVSPSRILHQDSSVRVLDGLVYIVNRLFADNIEMLDPERNFATQFQCSTGPGSNPRDIALAEAGKAYVTRFEESKLLIVNPSTTSSCPDFVLGSVDLARFADADGIPDMDQMAVVGDRLYVALAHLDIRTPMRDPAERGAIAVIDMATDQPLGAIQLSGEQPFGATKGLTVDGGDLVVSQVGRFGVSDGGIERIDLQSGEARGFFITEADLGGDITDFVLVTSRLAYAIISTPEFTTSLVAFDPATREVTQTLVESDGYTLFDIELNDRGELFLADRARNTPGVRIFRASDGTELTAAPLDVGLPPFEIGFLK